MEKSKINYQPDASEAHQEFNINFMREANDGRCEDSGHVKVHDKEAVETISKFLTGLGFKLRIVRSTDVTLLDEEPSEEETAGGEEEEGE